MVRRGLTNIWLTGRHVLVHSGYLLCHNKHILDCTAGTLCATMHNEPSQIALGNVLLEDIF